MIYPVESINYVTLWYLRYNPSKLSKMEKEDAVRVLANAAIAGRKVEINDEPRKG